MRFTKFIGVVSLCWLTLVLATQAYAWPVNYLDSTTMGNKPDCTACHYQSSGLNTINKIRETVNITNTVTVTPGGYFDLTFTTQGLGYGRFDVAGAVKVPDTTKWTAASLTNNPWMVAQQTTINGAQINSPTMLVTAFNPTSNPAGQTGVTIDNGSALGYIDRNALANNEVFSVRINVASTVAEGEYLLRVWGVGTGSNGTLSHNETLLTVYVNNDATLPSAPGTPSTVAISPQQIDLSWSGSSDAGSGIEGYWLYRKAFDEADYRRVAFTTSSSYSAIDLRDNTSYSFKVAAMDKAGNISTYSGIATEATPSGDRADSNPPSIPLSLGALVVGQEPDPKFNKSVGLSWAENPEADIAGYNVWRSLTATSGFVQINQSLITATEYLDLEVKEGTTYYYKLEAIDIAGNQSALSDFVLSTPAVDEGPVDPHGRYTSKQGACFLCHSTHTGQGPSLLSKAGITEVCYSCHDGSQSKFNIKSDFNTEVNPSHHKVPEGRYGCDECHNPHLSSEVGAANPVPKLLETKSLEDLQWKNSGNEFCWACHGIGSDLPNPFGRDHQTAYLLSKHNTRLPEPSTGTGIKCTNCHKSHGSRDYPLLVSSNSANFCKSCHEQYGFTATKILLDSGAQDGSKTMWNMSQFYNGTTHEKRFYGRNTCTMCHEPHGSSNRYMLREPYYDNRASYDWQTNWEAGAKDTICFRCHDAQFYVGVNATGNPTLGSKFGNGNAKNYHSHVTNGDISCRYCHDPHSGKHNSHNEATQWNLDNSHYVNFEWAYQSGLVSPTNSRLAFVPIYASDNITEVGFSCAMTCHTFDHIDTKSSTGYKSYGRTKSSPALKCAACHDHDVFDTNSKHPVLPDSGSAYQMTCEMCHTEDHSSHKGTNPYGLKSEIFTTWDGKTTELADSTNPITGELGPNYGAFCWQCHGTVTNPDPTLNTRDIMGDKYTHFINKPHARLQRSGSSNPYGEGLDMACLSCHDHHASRNLSLIKSQIDGTPIDAAVDIGKINACMACHDGSPAPVNIAAKYNATRSGGHYLKSNPTKKLLCTECHDSHGSTNLYYLLDTTNKYGTGVTFPSNRDNNTNAFKDREFCLPCHPGSDEAARPYDTTNTLRAGAIMMQPLPASIAAHASSSEDSCVQCHDPHKPWPATGSNDKCYSCHSPQGEASDTYSKMGLTSEVGSGLPSKHRITDGDSVNNTCMLKCHTAHPHSPRANSLNLPGGLIVDEESKCLSCHDSSAPQAPRTIDQSLYEGTTHDYNKVRTTYSDDSEFKGNCTKCHTPHGSLFAPLLAKPKDELCVSCHDGVAKDQAGNAISDIKTIYTAAGHSYKDFPGSKMYCDECHVPHGSSNVIFLRDRTTSGQSIINEDGTVRNFPTGLGADYNTRQFCTICHLEYTGSSTFVKYSSQTAPGGTINIPEIPLYGSHGVYVPEHQAGNLKACSDCHNPHDPEPVGNNKDCFICHGYEGPGGVAGYATNIQSLTGYESQAAPTGIMSSHPIGDGMTVDNDCMKACHLPHVHNPRADLLRDFRTASTDTVAPEPPTELSVAASSGNQVDVKFMGSSSENVFGYYIYKDYALWGVLNNNVPLSELVFQDGGIKGEAVYSVSAFNKGGYESAQAIFGPTLVGPNKAADTIAPLPPQNLTAMAKNSTRVNLAWLRATDNYAIKEYRVYRSTSYTSGYTLIGISGTNSFSEGGLQEKQTYYYRVAAVDYNGNESGQSLVASVTMPSIAGQTALGLYSEGTETVELVNNNNTRTIFFNTNDSFKVRLSSTSSAFSSIQSSQIVLKEYHGSQVAGPYTSYVYSSSGGMNTYEWSVATLDLDGLYQVELQGTDSSGQLFKVTESIIVGATTERMKTYADAGYTQESVTFKPGDRVYVEASSSVPLNGYVSQLGYLYNYRNGLLTNPVISSAYSSGYIRYSLQLPSTGLNDGWWYTLGHYVTSNEKRRPIISNAFKQIKIKLVDTEAPTVAGALGFVNVGSASLTVTWTASTSTDVAGYNVYRSLDGTNYTLVGSTENQSFIDTGLLNANLEGNINYYYQVKAYDLAGNLSTPIAGNTYTAVAPTDNTQPSKPVGINAVGDGPSRVKVSWAAGAVTEGIQGYSIYRSSDGVTFNKVGVANTTTFIDAGMQGGSVYYYWIKAYDLAGNESEPSVKVSVLVPPGSDDSIEAALCMSCHDGSSARADWGSLPSYLKTGQVISTAYLKSKHNVNMMLNTYKDGSQYYGNCTKCHVPHGSVYPKLLINEDNNDLCFKCHTPSSDSARYSGKATYVESAHGSTASTSPSGTPRLWPGLDGTIARQLGDEGRCYNCHTPHARYVPNSTEVIKSSALAGDSTSLNALCYGCHKESGYDSNGVGIAYDWEWQGQAVYEQTAHGDANRNGLMRLDTSYGAGECANCHDPHGTRLPGMLSAPLNVDGTRKNELCLRCHDKADVLQNTGLFEGSEIYLLSRHGQSAQWLEELNHTDYNTSNTSSFDFLNKTSFLPGVCANCHNSHGQQANGVTYPKMLVVNDTNEICNRCHESPSIKVQTSYYAGKAAYDTSAHKSSAQWTGGRYFTRTIPVADKGKCVNCHDPHGVGRINESGVLEYIDGAVFDEEEMLCYECHDNSTNKDLMQFYSQWGNTSSYKGHAFWETSGVYSATLDIRTQPRRVECLDCHDPHQAEKPTDTDSLDTRVAKVLKGSWGVTVTWPSVTKGSGTLVQPAANDYTLKPSPTEDWQICFKCHSTYTAHAGQVTVVQWFNPNNISAHGFGAGGRNATIKLNKTYLLNAPWSGLDNPKTRCLDCHGADVGPRGPHGSNLQYMLKKDPKTMEFCTQCHKASAYVNTTDLPINPTDGAKSRGYSAHAKRGHYSQSKLTAPRPAFLANYGTNWCRGCHFAGQSEASAEVPMSGYQSSESSVHGTNAPTGDKGLNGFYLRSVNTTNKTCADYLCNHNSGTVAY